MTPTFSPNGFYSAATRVDAHAGRTGGTIAPEVITVHTTDTMPGTSPAIVNAWSKTPGNGACAHFVIDRVGKIVQLVSIYRNGNHAGGYPAHGWFRSAIPQYPGMQPIHPNTIAVGIETENAGYLGKPQGGKWIHPDTKREIPASDVQIDVNGRGWHKATDEQLTALIELIDVLEATIKPMRQGLTIVPNGTYKDNGVPWAEVHNPRVHAHAALDPTQKTDCGPFILQRLRDEGLVK